MSADRTLSRRNLLTTTLGAATVSLAGCSGGSNNTPANDSEDESATGGNGDRNETRGGNETENGNETGAPAPQLSVELRAPGGDALEEPSLGDRTTDNASLSQSVEVRVETNQDEASYTAAVEENQVASADGIVENGAYSEEFSLNYGSLLSQVGPGTYTLNLSAEAGNLEASDSASLSVAPPGITVDAPDTLQLSEGGRAEVNPSFQTIVDTEYTPDVEYALDIDGETVEGTELSYSRIAELLGDDLNPDGEVDAEVTAETGNGKRDSQQITLNLSLADLSGVLERANGELTELTLSPEEQANLQVREQSDIAEYSLQIQNPAGANWNRDIEERQIELDYDQLLDNLGAGEHTLQLQAQTPHQTTTVDNAQIYLEEPGPEQRYSVSQNWPEYLEMIPANVQPGNINFNNMRLFRGEVPQEVQRNDVFNPEDRSIAAPARLNGNREMITEGFDTQISYLGQYFTDLQIFDNSQEDVIREEYFDSLQIRDEDYNGTGVDIYEDHYETPDSYDVVVAPLQFGDKFLHVRGEYQGVQDVIDTVHGEIESLQGEVDMIEDVNNPESPNSFIEDNLMMTASGYLNPPQHLNLRDRSFSEGVLAEEEEFWASVYEDGGFEEMVVEMNDDGTYETHHHTDGKPPAQMGRSYIGR